MTVRRLQRRSKPGDDCMGNYGWNKLRLEVHWRHCWTAEIKFDKWTFYPFKSVKSVTD